VPQGCSASGARTELLDLERPGTLLQRVALLHPARRADVALRGVEVRERRVLTAVQGAEHVDAVADLRARRVVPPDNGRPARAGRPRGVPRQHHRDEARRVVEVDQRVRRAVRGRHGARHDDVAQHPHPLQALRRVAEHKAAQRGRDGVRVRRQLLAAQQIAHEEHAVRGRHLCVRERRGEAEEEEEDEKEVAMVSMCHSPR
jgi:hypothetical protein